MLNDNTTNGYVIFDLLGVDLTTASQNITGIYKRVKDVFEADKPIIMAVDNIPPFAVTAKKVSNYYELVSEFYVFDINTNDILIIRPNSGSFTEVTITPSLLSGTKIADYSVGDTSGSLYAPEQQTEINDSTASDHTTFSSDKINTLLSGKADTDDIPVLTDLIDDSSTSESKVWSAYRTNSDHVTVTNHDEYIGNLSDDFAAPFSTSTAYAVGDYVLYGKILYRFTSAKTAGAWDISKVTSVKVGNELKAKQDILSVESVTVTNNVVPYAGSFNAYKYGKLCIITGFAQYSTNQASGTHLFTVSETFNFPYFTSAITSSGAGVRIKLDGNGKVELESALNASQWMSISIMGFLV